MNKFTLISPNFINNGFIPRDYSCTGNKVNPELKWYNVPPTAKSLMLVLSDPDTLNPPFIHWIMYNIPSNSNGVSSGQIIGNQGLNSGNQFNYTPICPPPGQTHRYIFHLLALDTIIPTNNNFTQLWQSAQNHIIDSTYLTGFYSR